MIGRQCREHSQRDCIFLPHSSLSNIISEVSRCIWNTFWKKNWSMSLTSPILPVPLGEMITLLAGPRFSQGFFFPPVTNRLNIMEIPYAWFTTFSSLKLHIHVTSTMKSLCSKAKCFTVHTDCSRNQTINQKFQGSKTIWGNRSIQLNGMHLFQRAGPKFNVLHREGTAITNFWMNRCLFHTFGNNKVELMVCWKTRSLRKKIK